jgi:hypothetical protein
MLCWLFGSSIGFREQLQDDVIDRLGFSGGKSSDSAQVRGKRSSAEGVLSRIPPDRQPWLCHQQCGEDGAFRWFSSPARYACIEPTLWECEVEIA